MNPTLRITHVHASKDKATKLTEILTGEPLIEVVVEDALSVPTHAVLVRAHLSSEGGETVRWAGRHFGFGVQT